MLRPQRSHGRNCFQVFGDAGAGVEVLAFCPQPEDAARAAWHHFEHGRLCRRWHVDCSWTDPELAWAEQPVDVSRAASEPGLVSRAMDRYHREGVTLDDRSGRRMDIDAEEEASPREALSRYLTDPHAVARMRPMGLRG